MQNTENDNEEEEKNDELEKEYLTFWTDNELFGIPISNVVQIISMQGITSLPDFPAYAKGVINLRGIIIPVIDVRIRFGKPEAEYNDSTCIIVTSIDENYMGFIVDSVDEVTDIDTDNITPPPKVSKDITNRYLTGIGQVGDKVVLLIDPAKILTENEFEEVSQTVDDAKAGIAEKPDSKDSPKPGESKENTPAAPEGKKKPEGKDRPEDKKGKAAEPKLSVLKNGKPQD